MMVIASNAHGEARQCASCKLTYYYKPAKTFSCLQCHTEQPWDGWPSATTGTTAHSPNGETVDIYAPVTHVPGPPVNHVQPTPEPIDLHSVHAHLNQMSSDMLQQLRARLEILSHVDMANSLRSTSPEYFARVRQALAGAGVKF